MPEVLTTVLPKLGVEVKLGRRRPRVTPQVMPLKRYLLRDTPTPPDVIDYAIKAMLSLQRVYVNNSLGDCVIASKFHAIGVWSGNDSPNVVTFSDADAIRYYGIIGGYIPGRPSTDRGCSIVDALNYFKSTGFNGHKIAGYVGVNNADIIESKVSIDLFGGLTLGLNLPDAWVQSAAPGAVWGPAPANPNNGHDARIVGFTPQGVQLATWGFIVTILWAAFTDTRIVEECYAEVGMDWVGTDQKAPPGVSLQQLLADLNILAGGGIPPLPGPTPPPPPPPGPTPPGTIAVDLDGSVDLTHSGLAKMQAANLSRFSIHV